MLILGCGYLGRRLLKQLNDTSHVTAVVRSEASAELLSDSGAQVIICDLAEQDLPTGCTLNRPVLYFAPPPGQGEQDPIMRRFLDQLDTSGQPTRVLYVSTTGVYGNCDGEWVDETRPVNPGVDRSKRRWDAEQALREWRSAYGLAGLVILRVAGIYGPGKLPLERLQKQTPMVPESAAPWTNRIHVDDLARVCLALLEHGEDGEVYNVSDGVPGNMSDYFNQVADRAGLARPPLIDMDQAQGQLSPGLLSYLAESRRLDNSKMLRDSGITLVYPDLETGLDQCFNEVS